MFLGPGLGHPLKKILRTPLPAIQGKKILRLASFAFMSWKHNLGFELQAKNVPESIHFTLHEIVIK